MAALRIPHTIGSSAVIGSTDRPELWALVSYDGASEPTPEWVTVSGDVRSFSTSRGRESELVEMDAGTASVVLDNRDNDYDPGTVRPMNRLWLREQFAGLTNDLFKGYVEAWDQQWPGGGADAICVAQAADEFKPLTRDALPVTDPPRDTYADVVLSANPAGYWKLNGDQYEGIEATVGRQLNILPTSWTPIPAPIIEEGASANDAKQLTAAQVFQMVTEYSPELNMGALPAFAVEFWFMTNNVAPAGGDAIIKGPFNVPGTRLQYQLVLAATGQLSGTAYNTTPTLHTVTSPSALTVNTWYHVVLTIHAGFLRLYLNGVQVASTAWTGVFEAGSTSGVTEVGDLTGVSTFSFDELAIYRAGMDVVTALAHRTAGVNRSYPEQDVAVRIGAVLDTAGNDSPRYLRPATRDIRQRRMHGQSPLEEMRLAREAEGDNSVLFVAADGTLTFLDAGHRSVAPWTTAQAIFSDVLFGPALPYLDIDVDYSDAFLFNVWNVTNVDGALQSASDATSIEDYGQRVQNLTTQNVSDGDASNVAVAMLAKYKDPLQRVTSISLVAEDSDLIDAVFQLELMDKIRVIRDTFDQSLWIQKIEVDGTPDGLWRIRLGVSPL